MYIRITPKGAVTAEHAPDSEQLLNMMQGEVGGLIELVHHLLPEITDNVPSAVMVVNEEGWLKELHFNPLATVLCGEQICGNALLLKIAVVSEDGEQDIVPLSDSEAQSIMRFLTKGRE